MIHKALCLFLLLPVSASAMSESVLPELVMIYGVSMLEYDDILQVALFNKAWNSAVEKTFNYRREFISECLRAQIGTITHTQAFNEHDLQWNNRSTACCFVDLAKNKLAGDETPMVKTRLLAQSYPALFRVQLTKQTCTSYDGPITVSHCRINDQDSRFDKQRFENGFGLGRTYVFTPSINKSLDNKCLTCFLPFFNQKGDACVHTFRTTTKKESIMAYTLSSKGIVEQRFCFVEKDGIVQPLEVEDNLLHFIAFQFATVEETENFKTFVFDDIAKQKLLVAQVLFESIAAALKSSEV